MVKTSVKRRGFMPRKPTKAAAKKVADAKSLSRVERGRSNDSLEEPAKQRWLLGIMVVITHMVQTQELCLKRHISPE